ncbi:MAG TPA: O-antigen ligase family protein [Nitrospira sp.]|nr:O-antigen ligase family protein [Nitrospira sp.]
MSDRHSELTAFSDGLPATPVTPVRFRAPLGRAVAWLRRRSAARGLEGFGAVLGGLALFSPLIDGGTTQLPVLVIRLILLVSGAIWLLYRMKAGEFFVPRTGLEVCVALFAGWAILSLFWSPYKNASLQWVLSILSYAAVFAMVTHGLPSHAQIRALVLVVTGIGVAEAFWGITQYLWMGEARARGTFFNPNFFGAYEAAVCLLSLGMLLFTSRQALTVFLRRWLCVAASVSCGAVVMAQSRGASAALVGAASFLGCSRFGKKGLVVVSLCLLIGLLLPNPLQHRILHAAAQDPYAYTRLDIWKSALMRLSDQPLGIGVGMFKQGSFQARFPIEGDIVRYRKRPESAHNEYLQMGVELGVVGLVLFVCGTGLWGAEIRQLLRVPAHKIDRGLVIGLASSALVLLLHAAVDSTFHEPALVILLVLMSGLVHNLYVQAKPEAVTWRRIGFSHHPLRMAYVLAGALVIAAVCAQSALAWYAHEQGKRQAAQNNLEGALASYIRAADIDPGTTGYHDSIARTAMQLYAESGQSEWLLKAAEEEAVARKLNRLDGRFPFRAGTVYRLMASQALTHTQRAELLDKASEAYAEAIRLDPYSPFGYFELAQLRLADGRVQDAIALLTTATAHEPNFLPGRALLAEQSLRAGLPGDYKREYDAIKAVVSRYAHRELNETERRFLDVDLYPLGRALAVESMQ